MSLIDTWADNLNPPSKSLKMVKTVDVTPTTSGIAASSIVYLFDKDCPFDVNVINVTAIAQVLTTSDFNGSGGSVAIWTQCSDEVDIPPSPPVARSWDTLISSVECKTKGTDDLCFSAPDDGVNVIDETYSFIPKGGSLRAVLTAQVEDSYVGSGSLVQILMIAECVPTNIKDKRYF